MPSEFREPKKLSEWIELDYFRRARSLRRWRSLLTWGTLAVCVLVLTGAFLLRGATRLYQAGPVAPAHAMFNAECAVCHQDSFLTARRLWPGNAAARAVPDAACIQCHDGPPHNREMPWGAGPRQDHCAGCHREHQGQVALARMPDGQCVICHQDLKNHSQRAASCPFRDVTAFPGGHPDFALWDGPAQAVWRGRELVAVPFDKGKGGPIDPGRLRFNHQLHLSNEKVRDGGKPLECASCHQADATGRYMRPIDYEQHCQKCHPLWVRLTGAFGAGLRTAADAFDRVPAPHKEPAAVRAALRERLIDFARKHQVAGKPPGEDGRLPPGPRRFTDLTEDDWDWVKGQLKELLFVQKEQPGMENGLFALSGGCAHCHERKPGDARPDGLPAYEPTHIPQRWLRHGQFNHESHRLLKCQECHPAPDSAQTADVLLPRADVCARCHNPSVGARSDCVECHRYHDRDLTHEPAGKTIPECLGRPAGH